MCTLIDLPKKASHYISDVGELFTKTINSAAKVCTDGDGGIYNVLKATINLFDAHHLATGKETFFLARSELSGGLCFFDVADALVSVKRLVNGEIQQDFSDAFKEEWTLETAEGRQAIQTAFSAGGKSGFVVGSLLGLPLVLSSWDLISLGDIASKIGSVPIVGGVLASISLAPVVGGAIAIAYSCLAVEAVVRLQGAETNTEWWKASFDLVSRVMIAALQVLFIVAVASTPVMVGLGVIAYSLATFSIFYGFYHSRDPDLHGDNSVKLLEETPAQIKKREDDEFLFGT